VATVRWRLLVAYDGNAFRGFAAQPRVPTVAGALADALARTTRAPSPPMITCAGRTDVGVHARGQVVHVDLPAVLPAVAVRGRPPTAPTASGGEEETGPAEPSPSGVAGTEPEPDPGEQAGRRTRAMLPADLVRSVNRQLGPAIVVRAAEPAPPGFDARHSATARRYRYLVWESPAADPLLAPVAWHVPDRLDLRAMAGASDSLIGEHDFRAFCRRPPGQGPDEPLRRRVITAGWSVESGPEEDDARRSPPPDWAGTDEPPGDDGRLLRFDIEANAFCHQMVRSLVATLVEVGRGHGNAATLMAQLRGGTRAGAPRPAPPHGLCLVSVAYG